MKYAVQQIMLGTVIGNEKQALETFRAIQSSGYDGIELNGFMMRPASMMIRLLTKAAGMPIGKGGKLDWKKLLDATGLTATSIHEDLGRVEREVDAVIDEAKAFQTDKVVITGMYRFDYTNQSNMEALCERLNASGKRLEAEGIHLLYHNHNIEFLQVGDTGKTAYDFLIEHTNPAYVNFELDSYWAAEAGVCALSLMDKLGSRMKLYHINDRGTKVKKLPMTPILQSDSMELGTGNMDLDALIKKAMELRVEAIIVESHRNWLDNSPIASLKKSAEFLKAYK